HRAQRLRIADDDLRAAELDPTEPAPIGKVLIDDLARDAEEACELGLRDAQLEMTYASRAAVQRRENQQSFREPRGSVHECGFLDELARPAQPLAHQLQQMDREPRFALEERQEVRSLNDDQSRVVESHGIRGSR